MWDWLRAIDELQEILGVGAVLAIVAAAMVVGRAPARWAAGVALADSFILALLSAVLAHADRVVLVHAKAVIVLLAYAALVVRWPHRWLVLLAGLQGFAVLLHLAAWIDRTIVIPANALLLNGIGWAMLLVLLYGAISGRLAPRPVPSERRA
jgi:hypothetical protein